MKIDRIFNNNSVGAKLADGREAVLVGPGIGFNKHRGDEIDTAQVEKRFILEPSDAENGMRAVLISLPYPVVELTGRIAVRLEKRHEMRLTPAVEIALADHLAAALKRLEDQTTLFNDLLFETKAAYRQEFRLALEVLDWVEELSGQRLPMDEAGFITLHLVNAGLGGNMAETQRIASAVRGVLEIVRIWMPSTGALGSDHIERFLTHLKFVARRLSEGGQLSGGHEELFLMLSRSEPECFECAQQIAGYLHDVLGAELSRQEVLYLMIHLSRLRNAGISGTGVAEAADEH
ncbi:PRD domain-containing protein [Paenarthrobacter nicotinovorans]|uniref:PRD domain-containing protein n=1 Tax=Paenarthrobacter nicotinovorans TaxID=29320 RepID=UPI0038191E92